MLKPREIEKLPENLIELYSQMEQDVLADMARRIATYDYYIPAAEWQYRKMIELGNYDSYIKKSLTALTGKTEKEIEYLMEEAGMRTLAFDDDIYKVAGLKVPPISASPILMDVLNDGIKSTKGLFRNLTNTTANTSTKQFENALDRAYLQIVSGAFDKDTAVRNAVKVLAREGVQTITYKGGRTATLETAVRRAIVTGVNQTALRLQDSRADEMECDLVETTAHGGARPSHAEWQGQVFSRSGKHKKYPDFRESTRYGYGDGLGGWNCRHSFYPFFEGLSHRAYRDMDLRNYDAKKYSYRGEKLTEYEASQMQRGMERNIRRWEREEKAMMSAGLPTQEAKAKVAQWQSKQRNFIDQTGLKRQYAREQVYGKGVVNQRKNDIIRLNKEGEEFIKKLDFSQMDGFIEKLSDRATRKWYKYHDELIPSLIDGSKTLEEQARQACNLRIQYRTQARCLMRNKDARREIEGKYPSKSFEELLEHKKLKYGLTDEDAYRDILRSSQTSNKSFDKKAGVNE